MMFTLDSDLISVGNVGSPLAKTPVSVRIRVHTGKVLMSTVNVKNPAALSHWKTTHFT